MSYDSYDGNHTFVRLSFFSNAVYVDLEMTVS